MINVKNEVCYERTEYVEVPICDGSDNVIF